MSDHPPQTHSHGTPSLESEQAEPEAGYVMPMTAMIIIPLMIFAALATDVGAWYIKADQAQRAADAAALAGTVWLPDQAAAEQVALDIAARNGFRDPAWVAVNGGTANANVSVPGLTADGGLRVDIETTSPSFFGKVVLDEVDIERRAVAAVTPAVQMGNPSNGLGTGNLSSSELGITPDGVWLSLNGWCQDHQQGDPFSVGYFGTSQAGGSINNSCAGPNLGANPTLDPDGYTFVVDVPTGASAIALEVSRRTVMDRMGAPPHIIRRQGQNPDDPADPVADRAFLKERAVAAIMLNGEQPEQERRIQNRQSKGQPVTDRKRHPRQRPKRHERDNAYPQLERAAQLVRFAILGQGLDPVTPGHGTGNGRGWLEFGKNCHTPAVYCLGQTDKAPDRHGKQNKSVRLRFGCIFWVKRATRHLHAAFPAHLCCFAVS